eukprot:CAMPEP_0196721994 /NCGR_PEP_ID=MMETSP1091-20130531/4427_1 /TAXON_ID=302021 /ORGANISM="Rhodomonas sp., Strain CCMP768" /LENGTH=315 /DNA_ID=CAMNT_0042063591 /DNA_START=71 /DNA_END=1019 /DNA_ORIENTATION=+
MAIGTYDTPGCAHSGTRIPLGSEANNLTGNSQTGRTGYVPSVHHHPQLLDGLNHVPVSGPALGQHHGVARHTPAGAPVGVREEEHALQHVEKLRVWAVDDGKRPRGACPTADLGGSDIVEGPVRGGGGAVEGVGPDSLRSELVGAEALERGDGGTDRAGGLLDVGMVVHGPDFVDGLEDVPAARPALGEDHGVAWPEVMARSVEIRHASLPAEDEKHLGGRGNAGDGHPPAAHHHDPAEMEPTVTSGRVASCGSPTSAFLRGPLGSSLSIEKKENGACEKCTALSLAISAGAGIGGAMVGAAACPPPRIPESDDK